MPRQLPVFYAGKLGQYFRDLRESHGWGLRQAVLIAEHRRLPVRLGALRWLEGGLTKNPEPELLRALSVLYGEPYGNIVQEVTKQIFGIEPHERRHGDAVPTSVEGFVALPVLATPIAAGQPLLLDPDSAHDSTLAFRKDAIKNFTRPVCLRVGRREASMAPTIQPGTVVLIDRHVERRRRPEDGRVYVVNLDALEGDDHGGAITRIETSDGILILTSDNPDTTRYPTRAVHVTGTNLPDILVGEVVWFGRYLGRGKRR